MTKINHIMFEACIQGCIDMPNVESLLVVWN